jgi:hypothetical protein
MVMDSSCIHFYGVKVIVKISHIQKCLVGSVIPSIKRSITLFAGWNILLDFIGKKAPCL